jgi:hypothetical protein
MLVKSATIKGTAYPLVLGMHLTEMIQQQAVKDDFSGVKMQAFLLYYGHENYCLVEGVENTLKLKDCFAHIEQVIAGEDDALRVELASILDAYMNSKPVRDIMEAAAGLEKKKVAGKK